MSFKFVSVIVSNRYDAHIATAIVEPVVVLVVNGFTAKFAYAFANHYMVHISQKTFLVVHASG